MYTYKTILMSAIFFGLKKILNVKNIKHFSNIL